MLNARALVGTHDVLFLVLDTLRYDVAVEELAAGRLPTLRRFISQWEERHTPGSFTYAAHQAFFAGFLPTPARPGRHPRLFATRFGGSETTAEHTCVFDAPDIIHGFEQRGYRTVCIGGVGFFNPDNALGRVLPGYFQQSQYSVELGVTAKTSIDRQVDLGCEVLNGHSPSQRVLLFINVSALHQPNCMYVEGEVRDSKATHAAALRYVDGHLGRLFDTAARRAPTLCLVMSDHGTCYDEDGFTGHRLAHPSVWTVPYAEFLVGVPSGPA